MKSLNSVILFFAVLAIIGAGLFFYPGSPFYYANIIVVESTETDETENTVDEVSSNEAIIEEDTSDLDVSENVIDEEIVENTSSETIETSEEVSTSVSMIDVEVSEKTLGSDDAPITMYEFSSLSCGHCGSFHSDAYPKIKSEYVETGKVKMIMVDFPLNLPAMQGAMLAHCLPDDQYFNFLQLLFTTQQNWLSGDYEANLKQNAQLAGLSNDQIDECLNNEALEEKLLARMEEAQSKWNVSSTPSFVINDGLEIIEGNRPYDYFETTFNKILSDLNTSEQ